MKAIAAGAPQALLIGTRRARPTGALIAGALLFAMFVGLVGALLGWVGQVLLVSLLVPAVLLLLDYRIGVLMLVLLLPYANSPLIPKAGPLNVVNLLLAGVCMLYLMRMALMRLAGKPALLPVPRELLWYYLVPFTAAMMIGTLHLGEIPAHFLALNKMDGFGFKEYWVGLYFKQMLLVFMSCVSAAAVLEYGKGRRFLVGIMLSGALFVVAMIILIGLSGFSLDRLKDSRTFLTLLGRHNNEAGVMLMGVFAPALFMHGYVRGAWAKTLLGGVVALTAIGVILTFSRGAFLGLAAVGAMYVFHFRRLKAAVAVLAVVLIGGALAPDAVRERLSLGLNESSTSGGIDAKGDELTAGRAYNWEQLAPEVLRSPLWGRGTMSTQWSTYVKTSFYNGNHPHNLYLEILMDMGLIGAFTMFIFYRYIWRLLRGLAADERVPMGMRGFFLGAAAGLVAMLIYGISNGHAYPAPEQVFFWGAIGLAIGYSERIRAMDPDPQPKPAKKRRVLVPPDRILGGKPA